MPRNIDAGVDYSRALIGPCSGCGQHKPGDCNDPDCPTCNPHAGCYEDYAELEYENEQLKAEIARLKAEIARLKAKIAVNKGEKRPQLFGDPDEDKLNRLWRGGAF